MLYDFTKLDNLIDSKSRNRVIKKVFDGDCDEYSKFINDLQAIENWEEAYKYMDCEFSKRNISINDNRTAVNFTDIVFKKFFPIYNF